MLAKNVMITDVVTAHEEDLVMDVFAKMRKANLRMLPVLDKDNTIVGVISTFCIMEKIIPEYVLSGDLNHISYAPDMGILHKHYNEIAAKPIREVMSVKPLLIQENESLLSIAATLSSYGRHEYAMVVDKNNKFLGVISAGDVLNEVHIKEDEVHNA